jgi:hypothetical protein
MSPRPTDPAPMPSHAPVVETTLLSPAEEAQFQQWARANQIADANDPRSYYDYRGYWKAIASQGGNQTEINAGDGRLHFTDTYKQHGHPTFSVESQYSRGLQDGGQWLPGDVLIGPPKRTGK